MTLFAPAVPYVVPTKMIDVINHLGLQSGLKLCLDAGDADSYTSGQKWLDRSGGGYDFFRGLTSGAEASDPTFTGTVGGQSSSEYWALDGGDFFTYDATSEGWMNNLHKNNAVFAIAAWVYLASFTTGGGFAPKIFGNNAADSSKIGISGVVRNSVPGQWRVSTTNGSGSVAREITTSAVVSLNAWTFLAVTLDEAADAATLQINGTQESFSGSYSSPSSSASTHPFSIVADGFGDAGGSPSNGSRIASLLAWESQAPSAAQLLSLYNATKSKYGL